MNLSVIHVLYIMFILHTSNHSSDLLEHLNTVLENPLSNPLVTEQFLIQSQGMQRWVCQQLADHRSVWANFDFYYPGKFFAGLVDSLMTENLQIPSLDRESLVWHFESILRDLSIDEGEVIYQYINGQQLEIKRYQLAKVLASLFDQYQFMRPEWFAQWQQNKLNTSNPVEIWQRYLWQKLEQRNNDTNLCSGLFWQSAIEKLTLLPKKQVNEYLPERLCVFGINAMSPLYMRFLKAIAQHINVHFYLLNPTQSYWADIPTLRKKLVQNDAESPLHAVSNPILSSLGQQGRDFQQLILETGHFELEIDSFSPDTSATLLAQIKNDILHNTDVKTELEADASLQIHCCHSRLREVEVIRDQVLECFANNDALTPRDIIIMAPDIQPYSAFIGSVFDNIPHSVADRSIVQADQPIGLFLEFLTLSQSRWELEPLLNFIENKAIYTRFGLLATDLELLRHWLEITNTRWGESGKHRKDLGFAEFSENTWLASLDRLLMGFMQSGDHEFCVDILPFTGLEGQQGQVLGRFIDFFELLSNSRSLLDKSYTLQQWIQYLRELSDKLISNEDDFQKGHSYLTEIITQLGRYAEFHNHKVKLEVVQQWLQETADNHQSGVGFMRGQLTFCSMLPMRAIPFKIIILMGMNESEFPHADRPIAFDLMANDYRIGDKSYRNDERYQILEVLLSAEEQLIISYVGQSQYDDTQIAPSIIITELLDILHEQYNIKEENIVSYHPLHNYNPQYFSPTSALFSYHQANLDIAKTIIAYVPDILSSKWWEGTLEVSNLKVTLNDLFKFYNHPQRYFLEQQLKIKVPYSLTEVINTEDFVINSLNQYQIDQQLLKEYLQGQSDVEYTYKKLKAEGKWPNGEAGKLLFTEKSKQIATFVEQIKALNIGTKQAPLEIKLESEGIALDGYLEDIYEHSLAVYRYANLKLSDYIRAWLNHCIYNMVSSNHKETFLLGKDSQWKFEYDQDYNYPEELNRYLHYFSKGLKKPSSLYFKPALTYQESISTLSTKPTLTSPIDKAKQVMTTESTYEKAYTILYPEHLGNNYIDLINQDFIDDCRLLENLWHAKIEIKPI